MRLTEQGKQFKSQFTGAWQVATGEHESLGRISRGMKVNEEISNVPRRGK
ncbi:uncharacterized protein METZ01_LOCUS275371 [marine metagenome]|uniref:Uncharacterized protein n=1 Tax=marine metagenome TaxID=408172 RepID=A0A382KHT6_9ZZZZ